VFIRYFDATRFLTLGTVRVHSTKNTRVGESRYEARQYDIEKNEKEDDFDDQPAWRNERHIVTDFHLDSGEDRYYVVAVNPEVSEAVYDVLLESMEITRKIEE
jgi:hypothetical protein